MTRYLGIGLLFTNPQLMSGCPDGDSTPAADECTVIMTWLQKDAYADEAGRTNLAWPPHTTTRMEVDCPNSFDEAEQRNHGTSVHDVDAYGTPILDVVKTETAIATPAEAADLLDAFESCHCDGTTFLSMDEVNDSVVQEVLAEALPYVQTNMTCSGTSPMAIVGQLQAGNADAAFIALEQCDWNPGHSWESALSVAIQATGDQLHDYHVCNNDALLQEALWDQFRSGGGVQDCNAYASVCYAPEFFYNP